MENQGAILLISVCTGYNLEQMESWIKLWCITWLKATLLIADKRTIYLRQTLVQIKLCLQRSRYANTLTPNFNFPKKAENHTYDSILPIFKSQNKKKSSCKGKNFQSVILAHCGPEN